MRGVVTGLAREKDLVRIKVIARKLPNSHFKLALIASRQKREGDIVLLIVVLRDERGDLTG